MDCSASEFLHSLIRFVSRRGVPSQIISDNAAQFQLAKILGDKAWKRKPVDQDVTAYASSRSIQWKFITELAPWQGGFYERLVGLVKSAMRATIRKKLMTWTDLVTLVAETEAVVNSRPITYVSNDINSRFRVLRPIDFLVVNSPSLSEDACADVSAKDMGEAGKRLVSIWKQRCRTLEKLWRVWHDEYLLSLRERKAVLHRHGRSDRKQIPFVGQVVLVIDSDAPRGQWRLARVSKLFPGADEQVRSVELKLASGIVLRRAINHIVPLEVEQADIEADEIENPDDSTVANDDSSGADQPPVAASSAGPSDFAINFDDLEINDNDNDDFFGFNIADIQRTEALLRQVDNLVDSEELSA